MPVHMLWLWQSGLCPDLVPAGLWRTEDGLHIRLNAEGLTHLASYAAACPDGLEDSFCTLLEALSSAALVFASLQRWLADPSYISLDPDLLFYDKERHCSLLTFSEEADSRPFLTRFLACCRGLGSGGALIAQRLERFGQGAVAEEFRTAAFLQRWIRQIRE